MSLKQSEKSRLSSPDRDRVEVLAEEFLSRYRRGERPSVSEYAARHPELENEIRELFPALVMMENVRPEQDELSRVIPTKQLTVGQFGDFRIIRPIGQGGMGVVYEAEQLSLGRRVALKVLPGHTLLETKHKQRFLREAKAAARLHHTNIVPVFGVGEQDGVHYYVMQYIRGLGLDEVLVELKRLKSDSNVPATSRVPDAGKDDVAFEMPPLAAGSHSPIASVDLARSLLTGHFEKTILLECDSEANADSHDASSPAASRAGSEDELASEKGEAIHRNAGFTDTERVNRAETAVASGGFALPGQSEAVHKSQSRQTYWHSIARIGLQAAQALDYAHSQGIIHRDVKPGNLLLDTSGNVWITDFGLAKAADQQDLTQTGDILGTLRYMAPEQFDGKADERSDLYALGLTLYELLSLQPAFHETDRRKLIKQVTEDAPLQLRTLDPQIPRDLETVVHKAIERDAVHRYRSARDLAEDLLRYLNDEPVRARGVSPVARFRRWCRRNPAIAALAFTIAVLLLAVTVAASLTAARFRNLANANADLAAARTAALGKATKNLALAKAEQSRADVHFQNARQAVDDMYTQVAEKWLAQEPQLGDVQREFLEKALAFYSDFAQTVSNDPEIRLETAKAFRRVAEIQHRFGKPAEAETAFKECVDRLQGLAEEFPEVPEYRVVQAETLHQLGVLYGDTGRREDEQRSSRRALTLQEVLLNQHPDNRDYRYAVASGRLFFGRALHYAKIQPEERQELVRQSVALLEELAAEFPDVPEYRITLSESYSELGDKARAVTVAEQLANDAPENPEYQDLLASNLYLQVQYWRLEDAEPKLRRVIDLQRKLAANYPRVVNYRYGLARSLHNVGEKLLAERRFPEAETWLRESDEICSALLTESPTVDYFKTRLTWINRDLAEALRNTEQWNDAVTAYTRLIELQPEELSHLLARARALMAIGEFERARQDLDAYLQPKNTVVDGDLESWEVWNRYGVAFFILKDWETAVAVFEHASELAPTNTVITNNLTASRLPQVVTAALEVRDFDRAESALNQTVALRPHLDVHPRAFTAYQLAAALDFERRYGRAEGAVRTAIDLQQNRIAESPDDSALQVGLSLLWLSLGRTLSAAGRMTEALDAITKSIEIQQMQFDRQSDDDSVRRSLAQRYYERAQRQPDLDAALDDLDRVLEFDPTIDRLGWDLIGLLDDLIEPPADPADVPSREVPAEQQIEIAKAVFLEAIKRRPDLPNQQFLADWLSSAPERFRDPDLALQLVQRAREIGVTQADIDIKVSLAWAQLCRGDAQTCLETLEGCTGDQEATELLRALAQVRLGNEAEARSAYELGCKPSEKYVANAYATLWRDDVIWHPTPGMLRRLRAEAAAALGIEDGKAANSADPAHGDD